MSYDLDVQFLDHCGWYQCRTISCNAFLRNKMFIQNQGMVFGYLNSKGLRWSKFTIFFLSIIPWHIFVTFRITSPVVCTSILKAHYFRIFDVWSWKSGSIQRFRIPYCYRNVWDLQRCLNIKLFIWGPKNHGMPKWGSHVPPSCLVLCHYGNEGSRNESRFWPSLKWDG